MRRNKTTSVFDQYKSTSLKNQNKIITQLEKKEVNVKLKEELLNETFNVKLVTTTLDREMQLFNHCKLITNNLEMDQNRFNFIASSFKRTPYSTIMDHKGEVESFISNYLNQVNSKVSSNIYKQEMLNKWMYKLYHQLTYTKINMIGDNFASILTDPERPTSFYPVIADHEYYAKLVLPFVYQIKTVNCLEGKGSPDLIMSTYDLNRLGFLKGKPIKGDYTYADLKTGGAYLFDQVSKNQNGERLSYFLKTSNPKIETFIVDINPVTKNINEGDEQLYIKKLNFVKKCKESSEGNKVIIIFDSNIPKIDSNLYYKKLAEVNGIDPEHFDQFKNFVDNYNAALLDGNYLPDILKIARTDDELYQSNLSNLYAHDMKFTLSKEVGLEVNNEELMKFDSKEYQSIATSIKYQNPNPFKKTELIQFFTSDD